MAEILQFTGNIFDDRRIDPEQMIADYNPDGVKDIVILSFLDDGEVQIASSSHSLAEINLLLDKIKQSIMYDYE